MEQWLNIAEKFGIPVVMLLGVSYALVKLFQWMAYTMMKQITLNQERTESINIKLIDVINGLKMEVKELKVEIAKFGSEQKTTNDIMTKLSGNGLGRNQSFHYQDLSNFHPTLFYELFRPHSLIFQL